MGDKSSTTTTVSAASTSSDTTSPSRIRILFAFDFDNTILANNSDVDILAVVPKQLPQDVKDTFDGTNWTAFMNNVFEFLHQEGATIEDIQDFIRGMSPAPGMVSLLQQIDRWRSKEDQLGSSIIDAEFLVISDANDIFISTFLSSIGVNADHVITNKAKVDEGRIVVTPYESQKSCPLCPGNLCKGAAVQKFLKKAGKKGRPFDVVAYVGDGKNDVCPAVKLRPEDLVFVRQGYNLEKIMKRGKVKGSMDGKSVEVELDIRARVYYWSNADSILEVLLRSIQEDTKRKSDLLTNKI